VTLKAQITGGYQPGLGHLFVVTRYTFSAQASAGGGSSVIKEGTPDATVSWIPNLPGSYTLSVTVKQTQGGVVAQATAQAECEVKKVAYQVTLNVSPPSGQAEAPPPTVAKKLIVSASVSPALPNATNAFSFVVQKMNGGVVALNTLRVQRSDASWPADPPQPAEPGLYRIAVQVIGYLTFPQGDVVVAEGQKEINYYEAKPARPFSTIPVSRVDDTATPTPFGWLAPITTRNTTLEVGTKYGSATTTIAGNSINAIVNNPAVRVRNDNSSCAQCHGGVWSRETVCSVVFPHAAGGNMASGYPADQILGSLITNWKGRNCPQ
jgi:hypothetical protein